MTEYAQINIVATLGGPAEPVASIAERVAPANNKRKALNALWRLFSAMAGMLKQGSIQVRVDSVACDHARLLLEVGSPGSTGLTTIVIPGFGAFTLVPVASDPDPTVGEFVNSGAGTTVEDSVVAAINSLPGLRDHVAAERDGSLVVVTAKRPGSIGNGYMLVNDNDAVLADYTGDGFLTGADPDSKAVADVACYYSSTSPDSTLAIGKVVFTAKASGATGSDQFDIGASNEEMAENLAAKVNAHPDLAGAISASLPAVGMVRLTANGDPRLARLLTVVSSDSNGMVTGGSIQTPGLAFTHQVSRSYSFR